MPGKKIGQEKYANLNWVIKEGCSKVIHEQRPEGVEGVRHEDNNISWPNSVVCVLDINPYFCLGGRGRYYWEILVEKHFRQKEQVQRS